jgi:DNA primase
MDDPWLTYKQAADKLGVSPQAARQKAIRGRWPRTRGNDGQARVQVPEQPPRMRTAYGQAPDIQLVDALRGQLAALESHIKTLQADNEALKEQLASERTAFAGREAALTADLAAELARTAQEADKAGKAIAAFTALAESFDALAAARARPWWRRLVG